jgi:hypothetical protein
MAKTVQSVYSEHFCSALPFFENTDGIESIHGNLRP